MSPLSTNQYSAVTRRTYPGLNYEALAASRGAVLPSAYSQADTMKYQKDTLSLASQANQNTAAYYKDAIQLEKDKLNAEAEQFAKEYDLKMQEIEAGIAAANEANAIAAEGYKSNYDAAMKGVEAQKEATKIAQQNAELERQIAEEQIASAEKAQTTSSILGAAGLGISAYGAYKTGLVGDALKAAKGVQTTGELGPGLTQQITTGQGGDVLQSVNLPADIPRESITHIDEAGNVVNDLGQTVIDNSAQATGELAPSEINEILSLKPTSETSGLTEAAQSLPQEQAFRVPTETQLFEEGGGEALSSGTQAITGESNIAGSAMGGVAPESVVEGGLSAQSSALGAEANFAGGGIESGYGLGGQIGEATTAGGIESGYGLGGQIGESTGASAGGSALSGAATVVAYIGAADMVRQQWGHTDVPYEERDPLEKFASTPGIEAAMPGSTLVNALVGNNDANFLVKASNKMGQIEENIVGEPLDSIFNLEWTWDDNFITKFDQGIKDSTNLVFGEDVGEVLTYVFNPVGALTNLFCFVAGTKVTLANGKQVSVEDLKLYDNLLLGGMVVGTGMVLETEIYSFKGVRVQGDHAYFDGEIWWRVKDHPEASLIELQEPVIVYPIASLTHLMVVDGMVFADMVEVDNAYSHTDQERLDMLNADKERNKFLKTFIDASGTI